MPASAHSQGSTGSVAGRTLPRVHGFVCKTGLVPSGSSWGLCRWFPQNGFPAPITGAGVWSHTASCRETGACVAPWSEKNRDDKKGKDEGKTEKKEEGKKRKERKCKRSKREEAKNWVGKGRGGEEGQKEEGKEGEGKEQGEVGQGKKKKEKEEEKKGGEGGRGALHCCARARRCCSMCPAALPFDDEALQTPQRSAAPKQTPPPPAPH